MQFLERAGIDIDIRQIHQFTSAEHLLRADEFFDRASVMLDKLGIPVLDNARSILDSHSGRWNPMGFMVLSLGSHPELGILRLHIWPKDLRKVTPKGEPIHNHAWHLESRILEGEYTDEIYVVGEHEPSLEDENERKERGFLRVFNVGFGERGGTLETDGSCVKVAVGEYRTAKSGEHHSIEQGVFHKTTIAHDKLVATLVFDAPTLVFDAPTLVSIRSKILIDGPVNPITEVRDAITSQDIATVKNQLG